MFGSKNGAVKSIAAQHPAPPELPPAPLEKYPFFAKYPDLPIPTAEDLEWGEKLLQAINKDSLEDAGALMYQAFSMKDPARIAIGLNIQQQNTSRNLLPSTWSYCISLEVCRAGPVIFDMYINSCYPTSLSYRAEREFKAAFKELPVSTLQKWVEAGCGGFLDTVFQRLFDIGTSEQIKSSIAAAGDDFNIHLEDNALIETALTRQDQEIAQIIFDQKPNVIETPLILLKLSLQHDNTDYLKQLIDDGIDLLVEQGAIFDLARQQQKAEHLEILETARRESILRDGLKKPCRTADGGLALSTAFIEYARPQSPDGSQSKYQVDFESGYMSIQYLTKEGYKPFSYQPLFKAYAENPQLIDKAIKALTSIGCPAPDLGRFFNNAAAKQPRQVTGPSTARSVKPASNAR